MSLDRALLPDPVSYYRAIGLEFFERHGVWRTTCCVFHGGSDSMRIHTVDGAFVCMAGCGARGGDVIAYHMASTGKPFVEACRDLGAWVDDGPPGVRLRPRLFTARQALDVLRTEVMVLAITAADLKRGRSINDADHRRLLQAADRIYHIAGML